MNNNQPTYKKARKLKLKIIAKSKSNFFGNKKSIFRGSGIEFDNLREYTFGDEIKNIDWKTYARNRKLLVKEYQEKKDISIYFFLDTSASNFIGSTEFTKYEIATEIITFLAYALLSENDRVGLVLFNDSTLKIFSAQSGLKYFHKLLREILLFQDSNQTAKINFNKAIKNFLINQKKKSVLFFFSDFLSPTTTFDCLKLLVKRHKIFSFIIQDPIDNELPNLGFSYLEDIETGEKNVFNTSSKKLRKQYKINRSKHNDQLKKLFKALRIKNIFLLTNDSYFGKLYYFFQSKN